MKKIIFFLIALIVFIFLIRGLAFIYYNLRGIGPAVISPPRDISKEIAGTKGPVKVGENTTGYPLKISEGFSVSTFAQDLGGPRVLTWDPSGNLLVSIPSQGKVVALPDKNRDGLSDSTVTVISGLNRPHGLTFHNGSLYVAEMNQVAFYDYDQKSMTAKNKNQILDLPSGGNHTTRTISFGPDGKLYISVGSTCNVCVEKDSRRAKIMTTTSDGSSLTEYASGLRNSVFFTRHPQTGMLWATDMGRDYLGDDLPPDEINIIEKDVFYGWPYCYGKNIWDTDFDKSDKSAALCKSAKASYIDIPAHSAPLGLAFIPTESIWPQDYWLNLLVSYHGSWNRTNPTGYKVVRYKLDRQGAYLSEEDFISGWLTRDGATGRPVDMIFDNAGSLYISDDKAGIIYHVIPLTK